MSEQSENGIHPVIAVVGAIAIAVGIIGAYLWVTYKGPVHTGQIVSLSAYPIHRELSTGSSLGGVDGGKNVYDETIVIADVRIQSTTKLPLFLSDTYGDVTLPDGEVQSCLAADATDANEAFIAYPDLAGQKKAPLPRGITMTPGQVVEGQVIFHYPISKQDWEGRKGFDVTVRFINQKSLVLHTGPEQQQAAK